MRVVLKKIHSKPSDRRLDILSQPTTMMNYIHSSCMLTFVFVCVTFFKPHILLMYAFCQPDSQCETLCKISHNRHRFFSFQNPTHTARGFDYEASSLLPLGHESPC
ncbi:hypothetical protein CEXT_36391 [Caerostris extrusa]|uniref:Transmembrane protein n=1 Tax=Caerostris extrusa TaxID=172846 RepID=A0AAV4XXU1_CAEEX|nr:hypothetical protein CEXT_36391 [Caerostris extrusa]